MSAQPRLTIGIDARAASEVQAGRGRLVRELLRELAQRDEPHQYRLFARTAWSEPLDGRFTWELDAAADPWWNLRTARRASHTCDVFLSSNSYLTGWFTSVPTVPVVYDLIAFERTMRPNRRSVVIERLTLALAIRRAKGIVCISQATADALTARYPHSSSRITVAPLGVASGLSYLPEEHELEELPTGDFVLVVGTLEPRKNLPRLVEAYRRLSPELQQLHQLVVVGAQGWETGETLTALRSLGERAVMLGHISDAALAQLYRRCALFCYPSLGEGFGLPVLEAMAAGAAVLTSNLSSLPEVGGEAVAYANPCEVDDIAAQLGALLGDAQRREELAGLARTRAQLFTWAHFAELTLRALERAARA
jgi:glycosyltransferase involved in cell wall biosynthesis